MFLLASFCSLRCGSLSILHESLDLCHIQGIPGAVLAAPRNFENTLHGHTGRHTYKHLLSAYSLEPAVGFTTSVHQSQVRRRTETRCYARLQRVLLEKATSPDRWILITPISFSCNTSAHLAPICSDLLLVIDT